MSWILPEPIWLSGQETVVKNFIFQIRVIKLCYSTIYEFMNDTTYYNFYYDKIRFSFIIINIYIWSN